MYKSKLKVAAVTATVSLSASAAAADCGPVSISEMSWASGAIVTSISKFIMEQGYGCEVTVVPTSTVAAITSVAETGEPEILTEVWLNAAPAYRELEAEGKIITVANVLSDGGESGWWLPSYLVDEHPQLGTIEGILANPELVGGMFHNCPEGWGCRVRWDNLIPAYGFKEAGIEVFNHGSGETLAASIAGAYNNKEPWFGYYWGPTSILGKYPMVRVDRGEYNEEAYKCVSQEVCDNPQRTGDAPVPVVTGVTSSLSEREPEIVELMSHVSFTNPQMNEVLAWQEENNASSDEAAVYFLTSQKDVWVSWISDDARAKLEPLFE